MFAALLALTLAQSAAPKPVTLALPGLNGVNLAPGEAALQAEVISQKFLAQGVQVMTARDLATVLGVERQKQLLGCAEDNQCLVEMTAALGTDGVLIADLGKLDGQYTLNLKVLASSNGKTLALHSGRAGDQRGLEVAMENAVRAITNALADSLKRPELRGSVATSSSLRAWSIAPAALGVAAIGAGVVLQVLAGQKFTELSNGPLMPNAAASLRDDGRGLETVGNVALVGGVVLLGAATTLFLLGGEKVAPVVSVSPQGASLGIVGVLP
jgi:hypothetical protein